MDNQEIFANGIKQKYSIPTDSKFTQICWSPDGDCLALGDDNSNCVLWSLSTGKSEWSDTGASAGVKSVAWDAKGQRIAIGCVDGSIQIHYRDNPIHYWKDQGIIIRQDEANGNCEWEHLIQLNRWGDNQVIPGTVAYIQWTNFPDTLLSSHQSGETVLWDLRNGEMIFRQSYTGIDDTDNTNSVDPRGNLLAFAISRSLQIWNIQPWRKEVEIMQDFPHWPSCLEWSKDGKFIAVATWNGKIFIFDIERRSCIKTINASRDRLRAISFSHDGSLMAVIGADQIIRVWRTEDWSTRIQLPDLDGPLSECLAFHPKYNLLAVGTKNGQLIKIFELS
ncbi:WD40 repeat domain-containing protein [Pelolinea submarina]|uniref:Anaphase-promoting complex subunit 4 n=1 Tax=Pelolinea submarina TaxID=913107 RepID=A0A347ZUJ1_9CHLR|nr:hypothetical protein [Pelolinea submarina]REG10440.1 anaphase-promoting complex subunit 4 [Pelolinea submarina]BBB48972.1 hypothetical protein Pelsub_P2203 [Pelolinea submarina]